MKTVKKIMITMVALIATLLAVTAVSFADDVTPVKPAKTDGVYQIGSPGELLWFSGLVNGTLDGVAGDTAANAKLTGNIDMTGAGNWIPIGSDSRASFAGTFDGSGKSLKISDNFNLVTWNEGVLKDLAIEGGMTAGNNTQAPFVAKNSGLVSGCVNKASLSSDKNTFGGIVGLNYGEGIIADSANLGDITFGAKGACGGIAAINQGMICNSYNAGKITFINGKIGGIAGQCYSSMPGNPPFPVIKNCYNSGELNGTAGVFGKIIGKPSEGIKINNVYAMSAGDAGACGTEIEGVSDKITVKDAVSASDLGDHFAADTNNINSGNPVLAFQNTGVYPEKESDEGLKVSEIKNITNDAVNGTVQVKLNKSFSYFKPDMSNFKLTLNKSGAEPKERTVTGVETDGDTVTLRFNGISGAELTNKNEEYTAGVKYKDTEAKTTELTLKSNYQSKYISKPEKIAKGDKNWPEYVGYYKISSAEELAWFAGLVNGELEGVEQNQRANAFLANDITCNNTENWENWSKSKEASMFWDCTIGKASTIEKYSEGGRREISYQGIFDGNYHVIKGLYMYPDPAVEYYSRIRDVALFPVADKAEIRNLGIDESYIYTDTKGSLTVTEAGSKAAGVVSNAIDTSIENCWFGGHVNSGNSGQHIAGIAALMQKGSTLSSCYNAGRLDGAANSEYAATGLAFVASPSTTSSYKPLVTIENCYNVGSVEATAPSTSYSLVYRSARVDANINLYSCYSTDKAVFADNKAGANKCFRIKGSPDYAMATELTDEEFKDGTLLDGLDKDAFCADDGNKNNGYPILAWQSDLAAVKRAAVKEVKYKLNPDEFTFSKKELEKTIKDATAAIEKCDTEEKVRDAKENAINELRKLKNDADITSEKNDVIETLKKEIADLKAKIEMQGAKVKVQRTTVTYNGKAQNPAVIVTGYSGARLKKGIDYTVSYKNNIKPGIAAVTVKGTGAAKTEVKKATFKIAPKKMILRTAKAGRKNITVTWKKGSYITGYNVQYSLNKSFRSAKNSRVAKDKTTKAVIRNLKSKRKYYVRVRAYKKVGRITIYGSWSKAGSAKVK